MEHIVGLERSLKLFRGDFFFFYLIFWLLCFRVLCFWYQDVPAFCTDLFKFVYGWNAIVRAVGFCRKFFLLSLAGFQLVTGHGNNGRG